MKVDKEKLYLYLSEQGRWQAGRCKHARNSDDGDVIAAAITMSTFAHLRHAAAAKLLTAKDIDVMMDAFLAESNMVEVFELMGGSHFERKPGLTP